MRIDVRIEGVRLGGFVGAKISTMSVSGKEIGRGLGRYRLREEQTVRGMLGA